VSEQDDRPTRGSGDGHPVLTGVLALVAVALAVGLILGGGALAVAKVLGLDDDSSASDNASTGQESMYLPKPEPTQSDSGPLITLEPDPGGSAGSLPTEQTSEAKPETRISLSSDQTAVGSMERIYLTGTYPGGEGAILQVQQWEGGAWGEFPVTASVSNETFTTYIQTSQPGKNRFRVVDTDTGEASNEVRITIG
jgi:hypothetical protein